MRTLRFAVILAVMLGLAAVVPSLPAFSTSSVAYPSAPFWRDGQSVVVDLNLIKFAAYVDPSVTDVNIGVKKQLGQRNSRAVEDCGLTVKDKLTKVCMTVWTTEPSSGANIPTVWVNCNGTARNTGAAGMFTFKATKGDLMKCVVDTPEGYGLRPFGAPGAEFQESVKRFTPGAGHVCVVVEMLKRP